MGKSKMFTLTGPDSRLSISVGNPRKKAARLTPLRIGQFQFTVHDGGPPCKARAVVDIPVSHHLFTFPITFATTDEEAFDLTEARFRKLLLDHVLNPEMFEDDDDDFDDDDQEDEAAEAEAADDDDGYYISGDDDDDDADADDDDDDDDVPESSDDDEQFGAEDE